MSELTNAEVFVIRGHNYRYYQFHWFRDNLEVSCHDYALAVQNYFKRIGIDND